jgi:hypothetical protein
MYRWYLLLASADVLLTWFILHNGGREANALAAWVINQAGMPGATFFKFATVAVVLIACEAAARQSVNAGRCIATLAVGVSLLPVVVGVTLIARLVASGATVRL